MSLVARLDFQLLGLSLGVTSVVTRHALNDEAVGDAEDKEQPEQVERLKSGQQRGRNGLRYPAFELAAGPVQLVGPDRAEFGEDGVDDFEVQVVAQVDPDENEKGKVGCLHHAVNVVQGFGGLL